jgi:uncharacterized paraquat-inducible protein A
MPYQCSGCRAELSNDALMSGRLKQCPRCGVNLSNAQSVHRDLVIWFWIIAVIALGVLLFSSNNGARVFSAAVLAIEAYWFWGQRRR